MLVLSDYTTPMGIQHDKRHFLKILLICLYALSSGSTPTDDDDGVSKREIIVGGQKFPFCPPDCFQQDVSPTHEKTVHKNYPHGLPYPETQRKQRKRRSAVTSSDKVEEDSVDRRRELYNDFLRKILRRNRDGKSKKEKAAPKLEEKKSTTDEDGAIDETSLKSTFAPSVHTENRDRHSRKGNQTLRPNLQSEKTLPTLETRRAYTLSPEQREIRRQILIKRNKEERLRRLREMYHRQNATLRPKTSIKQNSMSEKYKHDSLQHLSRYRKRGPKQKLTNHRKDNSFGTLSRMKTKPAKSDRRKLKFKENHDSAKNRNNDSENASFQRLTSAPTNEPTKSIPFITAAHANDYLTSMEKVSARKKYTRKVVPRDRIDHSTPPIRINSFSPNSNSRQSGVQQEAQLDQKRKDNKTESKDAKKSTSHGSRRRARISKNDKKRIRRIRKNRLKMRQRKRRKNRKRKHRSRKNRSHHKTSSPNPLTKPVVMTSSKYHISPTEPSKILYTDKHLQPKNNQETSTASLIPTTRPNRNSTYMTSALLETSKEPRKVNNASIDYFLVKHFKDNAVLEDLQVESEPKPSVNKSTRLRDTLEVMNKEIKGAGENDDTTVNVTTAFHFPVNKSTVDALSGLARAINLTQMHDSGAASDIGNSQKVSNGTASELHMYNASTGSAKDENHSLNETGLSDLNGTTNPRSSTERTITPSTRKINIITSSMGQVSQNTTSDSRDRSTGETSLFNGLFSKIVTITESLITSHTLGPPSSHDENKSFTISQSEKHLSSTTSPTMTLPSDSDNENNINDNVTSTSIFLRTEISSSSDSSTPSSSLSLSQSKTTMNPDASRWIAWAKRRRKKSKNSSKPNTKNGHSTNKSRGTAHGSVALALAKAGKEDSTQWTSSRRPITEPTTKKGPFIGYKTAYDFLSNQKGIKVGLLNENRRESRDINNFMGENMCEIFNKHYVPTRIGGKCV